MSTGLGCVLDVDGQRFADGSPGEDPTDPVALAGLKVVWGRSTTVEQPEPSTCAFQVMDPRGGRAFIDVLRTGLPVQVSATGTVYPDPTTSTFLDPAFDNPDTPVILKGGTGKATGGVFELHPADATRRVTATFAPAPFQPSGTNPAAWDGIPATSPGQTWSWTVRLATAPTAVVDIRPVLFTGPWANTYTVIDQPVRVTAPTGWADVTGSFTPGIAGAWVGVQVSVYPNGPRWVDLDPVTPWSAVDPAISWLDMDTTRVDWVDAQMPEEGTERSVLVYAGRITDLNTHWDDAVGTVVVDVTCQDFTADLANVRVGDEPWTVESMASRFNRVLALTGLPVTATIDADLQATLISYQDVDSQPAADLLRDLAQSVDGILWSAVHQTTGPYVHVEDPGQRAPLSHLQLVAGMVMIVSGAVPGGDALIISACDILRDPVEWVQDVADVTTRASVGWLEQGVDEAGLPATTDRTFQLVDGPLEATIGQRGISVGTMLQAEADAEAVATRVLARTGQLGWRANGLYIDDDTLETGDADAVAMLLQLLDGTTRNGRALQLTDLPEWAPVADEVGMFLEGGTYTYDVGAEGMTWQLDLTVSNSAGAGTSLQWDELDPTWSWAMFDPTITWNQLWGVGIAPPRPPAVLPSAALYPSPTLYPSGG
jgi:hypothetical protein